MAKEFCPHCDVMLTRRDLVKNSCNACGKKLPVCPSCDAIPSKKELGKGVCDACGKKLPLCPYCNVMLPMKDRTEGWCDACGKKLPLFLTAPQPTKPAPLPTPARNPFDSILYRFAWWLDRICKGLLLFVFASCVGVPALVLLFSELVWPFDPDWNAQKVIMMVQVGLIFVLVAGMLVAKGIKVLCGTDGS